MAIHHFLLRAPMEGSVGMSSYLRFDGSTVTVEWRGQTATMPAAVGDVVFVDCWGGLPQIGKTVPPKRPDRLALWLVGVPKDSRYASRDEAEQAFEDFEEAWAPESREYRQRSSDRWYIGQYRDAYTDFRWRNACGWVAPDITPEEVRKFVAEVGSRWSPEVTEKILAEAGARHAR